MHGPRYPAAAISALARSPFRRKFKLSAMDRACLREQGMARILAHAHELVTRHLTPAAPQDEGRQTPFRGHPVFVAQHATATCCRRCLEKWHRVPTGRMLSAAEENYIVKVIEYWLRAQLRPRPASDVLSSATA